MVSEQPANIKITYFQKKTEVQQLYTKIDDVLFSLFLSPPHFPINFNILS